MITIRNTQRKIKVNVTKLKKESQTLLDELGYPDYDLGIWLTTNKTLQRYNRDYRNKNRPTDILSFPFHADLKAGERIKPKNDDDKNLGDMVISLEFVKKHAKELGVTFDAHMQVLFVHGICHLLGYDHIKDADYEIMRKKEKSLLKKIS